VGQEGDRERRSAPQDAERRRTALLWGATPRVDNTGVGGGEGGPPARGDEGGLVPEQGRDHCRRECGCRHVGEGNSELTARIHAPGAHLARLREPHDVVGAKLEAAEVPRPAARHESWGGEVVWRDQHTPQIHFPVVEERATQVAENAQVNDASEGHNDGGDREVVGVAVPQRPVLASAPAVHLPVPIEGEGTQPTGANLNNPLACQRFNEHRGGLQGDGPDPQLAEVVGPPRVDATVGRQRQ
jgi:hypothetical protein